MTELEQFEEDLFKKIRKGKQLYSDLIARKTEHECMLTGCSEKAILSHTISKNFLNLIAEDGYVVCPELAINAIGRTPEEFRQSKKHNLFFRKTGINIAGTFKGFCSEHDNKLFESLDNNGIKFEKDIFLQVFRSACFSYFKNFYVTLSEEEIFGYQYHANTDFEEMQSLSQKKLINTLFDYIQTCPEIATSVLPDEREKPYVMEPYDHGYIHNFVLIYRRLPTYFDFALENDITFRLNEKFHHCVITLFPQKEYTNLIVACHKDIRNTILSQLYKEIDVLNFVEAVLMFDSLFFIKPSNFNCWSDQKKKVIIEDFYFCNERTKFYEPYDISLFDEIRKTICAKYNDDEHKKELEKIDKIPVRLPFEERNARQTWDFIKTRNKKLEITGNKSGRNYPHGPFIFEY